MVSPDLKQKIPLIVITLLFIGLASVGIYMIVKHYGRKDNFDINIDPLKAQPYDRKEKDCGTYLGTPPKGIGGEYGLTPEYDNDITVGNFVNKYEKDTVFAQYAQDLVPSLMYNQSAYDIPARQICEVLYQGHQQYFENMWSGLGECELYQTEQAKKAKNIKVITI